MKSERQKQQEFLAQIGTSTRVPDIVQGEHFIAGMRKLGYRHTANALDELIDNSLEAGATKVLVLLGSKGAKQNLVSEIAVVDNGIGMPAALIQHAVVWGGTHRPDSRDFFGRFGFGLPSACMSIGKRFEVYSKQDGGSWFMIPIDLEEIVQGDTKYRGTDGRVIPPPPVEVNPPDWVFASSEGDIDLGAVDSATVVLLQKIDNLSHTTKIKLTESLRVHFGTTYRNFLDRFGIHVDGKVVDPIDPLFLNPLARHFDVGNGKFGEPLPELRIPVSFSLGNQDGKDEIVCRFSYLPYGFAKDGEDNGRMHVMKDNLGIIFLRQGRQIEVVSTRCPWTKFQNNDMYCRIEVDFPAVLDEYFDVPTNKQQVVPSEHIWDLLKKAGVYSALESMRKRYQAQADEEKARKKSADVEGPAPSEVAMGKVARTTSRRPQTPRSQRESEALVEKRARQKAVEQGIRFEEAMAEVTAELEKRKFVLLFESDPERPFYWCRHPGGCVELVINTAHRFFSDVYSAPGTDARTQSGLEALLFVLSAREMEVSDELQDIYRQERMHWSSLFARVLKALEDQFDDLRNAKNVADQMAEDSEFAEATNEEAAHLRTGAH